MYKSIVRSRLDYGDVIYDQSNNASLSDKNKLVQYNTSLAITVAINGISKEKLYQEFGFESLKDRRWSWRLCYLHKIVSTKMPPYLYENNSSPPNVARQPRLLQIFKMSSWTLSKFFVTIYYLGIEHIRS